MKLSDSTRILGMAVCVASRRLRRLLLLRPCGPALLLSSPLAQLHWPTSNTRLPGPAQTTQAVFPGSLPGSQKSLADFCGNLILSLKVVVCTTAAAGARKKKTRPPRSKVGRACCVEASASCSPGQGSGRRGACRSPLGREGIPGFRNLA
jgi:hypothetical protein